MTRWPATADELVEQQLVLAAAGDAALTSGPWQVPPVSGPRPLWGGCFIAFASGEAGPGHAGDRAWAAAVTMYALDRAQEEALIKGTTGAAYLPGLLALREGPLLATALGALHRPPDVVLVDATGRDHPRRAGMALHLGAVMGIPSVGVTHRPLQAKGQPPAQQRGATSPLHLGDEEVARWVCTRTGARPVVAHAAWRTDPATAALVVLMASTTGARTPAPLREARRLARETRAVAEGRAPEGRAPDV
ncbi:MAG TPA: endonuclease V [Acidimicrobiales bacterium]|nr:endonuclease V [Acidimicrobiales bacterium]